MRPFQIVTGHGHRRAVALLAIAVVGCASSNSGSVYRRGETRVEPRQIVGTLGREVLLLVRVVRQVEELALPGVEALDQLEAAAADAGPAARAIRAPAASG